MNPLQESVETTADRDGTDRPLGGSEPTRYPGEPEGPQWVESGGSGQATRLPLLWVENDIQTGPPPSVGLGGSRPHAMVGSDLPTGGPCRAN
jgi:hypothetical protein